MAWGIWGKKKGTQVSFINKTALAFLVPTFKSTIKNIVNTDERCRIFQELIFILEDEANYPNRKQRDLLNQVIKNPEKYHTLGYVRGKEVIRIDSDTRSISTAIVHVVVDSIVYGLLDGENPKLIESINDLERLDKASEQLLIGIVQERLTQNIHEILVHELTHAIHHLRYGLMARLKKINEKRIITKQRILKNVGAIENLASIKSLEEYSVLVAEVRYSIEL